MPVVRMEILEIVVPAGMLKVKVLPTLHGAGVVLPDGQTLTLPKFTAWADADTETDARTASQTIAARVKPRGTKQTVDLNGVEGTATGHAPTDLRRKFDWFTG